MILLNPGGVFALGIMIFLMVRRRSQYEAEVEFTGITLLSTLGLILAYCMLVFDGRYVIPFVRVLIALGCPVLLPADLVGDAPAAAGWGRKIAVALVVASTVFFTLYWASPLRTVDRDFEASCQQAADDLRNLKAGGTMVSIGRGPYPEHGVGFEMGNYVSYLAGWRLVGGNVALPDSAAGADDLVGKALASKSDAVAVRALRSTKCMHGLWAEPRRGTAQQRP